MYKGDTELMQILYLVKKCIESRFGQVFLRDRLDILLRVPFKAVFYLQVQSEHRQTVSSVCHL
jgi:hypothetical protein